MKSDQTILEEAKEKVLVESSADKAKKGAYLSNIAQPDDIREQVNTTASDKTGEEIENELRQFEDVCREIAKKILDLPDNKPEHAADHRLYNATQIIMNAMRMQERKTIREHSVPSPVKTAEEVLEKHCPSMNNLYLDDQGRNFRDRVVKAMEEYASQFKNRGEMTTK